jgi:outer membrane protein assembly factor BamD
VIRIVALVLLALSTAAPDKTAAAVPEETAERHMIVARYYVEGRRDYVASINRFKIVLMKFQSSQYVEEALAGLTEAYLALGIASEAQTAAAVLACKFPNGSWTEKARAALKSAGLDPVEHPASWISRVFQQAPTWIGSCAPLPR